MLRVLIRCMTNQLDTQRKPLVGVLNRLQWHAPLDAGFFSGIKQLATTLIANGQENTT